MRLAKSLTTSLGKVGFTNLDSAKLTSGYRVLDSSNKDDTQIRSQATWSAPGRVWNKTFRTAQGYEVPIVETPNPLTETQGVPMTKKDAKIQHSLDSDDETKDMEADSPELLSSGIPLGKPALPLS